MFGVRLFAWSFKLKCNYQVSSCILLLYFPSFFLNVIVNYFLDLFFFFLYFSLEMTTHVLLTFYTLFCFETLKTKAKPNITFQTQMLPPTNWLKEFEFFEFIYKNFPFHSTTIWLSASNVMCAVWEFCNCYVVSKIYLIFYKKK